MILNKAITMCRLMIGEKLSVTDLEINNAIDQIILLPMFKTVDSEVLRRELLSIYCVDQDAFRVLEGRESRMPWLKEFLINKPKIKWHFWKRYEDYLINQKGFAPKIISNIDDLTDLTIDKFFNPTLQDIGVHKKGLVVGQVQSGKTANYTGLICKAADTGFDFIIVLAGIHNNLRSQTQLRLDEGFLGFDTMYERAYTMNQSTKIGVGKIPGFTEAIANSVTTSDEKGDFTKRAAETLGVNFNTPQPILVVVKKNSSVLKRLFTWLNSQDMHTIEGKNRIVNKSLLIIDDEADNASINTNKIKETPTAINGWIRKINELFFRSAYVGYTATPFANIFIPTEKEDLFPSDFIINLPAPTNYIGPDKIFGTSIVPDEDNDDLLPIVRTISDYEQFVPDKHKKDDDKPDCLPDSLKVAIKSFILTCAIRILRGQENKHNSMLIHVTRYVAWQNHIRNLVEEQFLFYRRGIEQNIPSIINELREIYEVDTDEHISYKTTTKQIKNSCYWNIDSKLIIHNWEDVQAKLYQAVIKIEVKSINGKSIDALKYYENEKNGLSVIAIGGDKLSRGLTLEGLSVSYYLRASKMYDTLMQMGRWFGYRPGYVDLCRLYTSTELNEWFRHITNASEELRDEFNYLAESGSTPDDYALKVRTHPGCLQITAINKMHNVNTITVSWSGKLLETYMLKLDKGIINSNYIATDKFLSSLKGYEMAGPSKTNYLWRDVPAVQIIRFLEEFEISEELKSFDLVRISKFISTLNQSGELTNWSIALMSKQSSKSIEFPCGLKAGCYTRNRATDTVSAKTSKKTYFIRKNHIVGNQADEFIDLSKSVLDKALIESKAKNKEWRKDYPSPKLVRNEYRDKSKPLLIIYPLNPLGANIKINGCVNLFNENDTPIIGFAISFPSSNTGHTETYAINSCLIEKYKQSEEDFEMYNDNIDDDE